MMMMLRRKEKYLYYHTIPYTLVRRESSCTVSVVALSLHTESMPHHLTPGNLPMHSGNIDTNVLEIIFFPQRRYDVLYK